MWQYRELIQRLTITEFKTRYQNTSLGFFWSILSPLLLSLVLYFVFRNVFQQEENYAANLLVGVVSWRFFNIGTNGALVAIVGKPSLVTKVYVPRQILVMSSVLANIMSSLLEFLVLVPILYFVAGRLPITIVLFPVIHVFYFLIVYGVGLLLSSLFVYFRDINQIWEVLTTILFYATPIIYPISVVSQSLLPYFMLNPLARIIIMYRDVMVAGNLPTINNFLYVIAFGIAIYIIGRLIFARLQRRFAEAV
jgi:lipopolysaccharide transport system permease protein